MFCFILTLGTACLGGRKKEEREGEREKRKDKDDLTSPEIGEKFLPPYSQ